MPKQYAIVKRDPLPPKLRYTEAEYEDAVRAVQLLKRQHGAGSFDLIELDDGDDGAALDGQLLTAADLDDAPTVAPSDGKA